MAHRISKQIVNVERVDASTANVTLECGHINQHDITNGTMTPDMTMAFFNKAAEMHIPMYCDHCQPVQVEEE
jgi:Cu/Ag efflux protein CusF